MRTANALVCVFLLPALTNAQTPPAPAAGPPPRWERKADLSMVATGGNTDIQTVGVGGSLVWRPGVWTTEARAAFVRNETSDVVTARSLTADIREGRALTPRLDAFGRAGYLSNEFAGIDDRITVDGGLGYKLLTGPVHTLRADAGLGYSHESRVTGIDLAFPLANFGGGYKWQFSKTADLSNAALFTASLDDGDDWRFGNAVAVTAAMTRALSLKLSQELKHVNSPVPGFKKTDTVMSFAIVVNF